MDKLYHVTGVISVLVLADSRSNAEQKVMEGIWENNVNVLPELRVVEEEYVNFNSFSEFARIFDTDLTLGEYQDASI